MLKPQIRVLDFDGSILKQQRLLSSYPHQIISCTDLAQQARLWMNERISSCIQQRLGESAQDSVTFLGSGDFHHISSILLNQFSEPLSLIVFDLHPDWDILPPRQACGAWVTQVLKSKNILKCALLGVSSDDLCSPWIQSGNLSALTADRLEIYPYEHQPSTVFFRRVPENISLRLKKGIFQARIFWEELKNKNLEEFFRLLIKRLPTKKVYLSIDKDCLRNAFSLTNWEEGKLALDELILMLRLIKENLEIVGVDITGDYSKISVSGGLKRLFSALDHPKEVAAEQTSQEKVTSVNESTNLKILEALFR